MNLVVLQLLEIHFKMSRFIEPNDDKNEAWRRNNMSFGNYKRKAALNDIPNSLWQ